MSDFGIHSTIFNAFRTDDTAQDAIIAVVERAAVFEAGRCVKCLPESASVGEGADSLLWHLERLIEGDLEMLNINDIDDYDISAFMYAIRMKTIVKMMRGLLHEIHGKPENLDD
ncbi:hypothetical protein ACRC7T_18510 [Segnochrobactraceae bacterium EtOH-i3]